jgi:hypothetical protein
MTFERRYASSAHRRIGTYHAILEPAGEGLAGHALALKEQARNDVPVLGFICIWQAIERSKSWNSTMSKAIHITEAGGPEVLRLLGTGRQ